MFRCALIKTRQVDRDFGYVTSRIKSRGSCSVLISIAYECARAVANYLGTAPRDEAAEGSNPSLTVSLCVLFRTSKSKNSSKNTIVDDVDADTLVDTQAIGRIARGGHGLPNPKISPARTRQNRPVADNYPVITGDTLTEDQQTKLSILCYPIFILLAVQHLSARARRQFSRSADRRGADARPGTVLRRRSSASMTRREHAVQFPVAAKQAPSRRPRCCNGEILKDATAVGNIFFKRRERDRPAAFVQGQLFPPKSSVD